MAATDAQLLAAAEDALLALLNGSVQSYSINGRTYNALNLTELRKTVNELRARVARASRGAFELGSFGNG